MFEFFDDDSFECESDLESEDEDVVAQAPFHATDDDESDSPDDEEQLDADVADGKAESHDEEQDSTGDHKNEAHFASSTIMDPTMLESMTAVKPSLQVEQPGVVKH